jgi:hypothetical protein
MQCGGDIRKHPRESIPVFLEAISLQSNLKFKEYVLMRRKISLPT